MTQSRLRDELVSAFTRTLIIPGMLPSETIGRLTGDPLVAGLAFLRNKAIGCYNLYATGKVQNRYLPATQECLDHMHIVAQMYKKHKSARVTRAVLSFRLMNGGGYPERSFYESRENTCWAM